MFVKVHKSASFVQEEKRVKTDALFCAHEQTRNASHFSFALLAVNRHRKSYMLAYILSVPFSVSAYA